MDRVLLVDDDAHILRTIGDFLRAREYEVFCAETASTALAVVGGAALDCIVLDVDLPDGSGYIETIRRKGYRFNRRLGDR